jgi:hypothetical protein
MFMNTLCCKEGVGPIENYSCHKGHGTPTWTPTLYLPRWTEIQGFYVRKHGSG